MPTNGYKSDLNGDIHFPDKINIEIWVDWHQDYGWVILDRQRCPTNGSGQYLTATAYFEELSTGQIIPTIRSDWVAPVFVWYRDRLESIPEHLRNLETARLDALLLNWVQRRRDNSELLVHLRDTLKVIFEPTFVPDTTCQIAPLQHADRTLADKWANDFPALTPIQRNYHQVAMCSARQAEIAAAGIYRSIFQAEPIRDLSILQLSGSSGINDWLLADVQVGTRFLDVKNARTSLGGRRNHSRTYVEHCVPKFKHTRSMHEVVIAGMLSEFDKKCVADDPHLMPTTTWLGEITQRQISDLKKQFESELTVDFSRVGKKGQFFPPWAFDYPIEMYSARNAAITRIREITRLNTISPAVSILANTACSNIANDAVKYEHDMLRERFVELDNLRRPVVYMHVLGRFVASLRDSRPFDATIFVRCLFLPKRSLVEGNDPASDASNTVDQANEKCCEYLTQVPAGVYDPLETIYSLIMTLMKVATTSQAHISRYRQFRMSGLNVLQGRAPDNSWETILAYCGGRDPKSKASCGVNPLFLGQDAMCPECRRLICHHCGYCKHDCDSRPLYEAAARDRLGVTNHPSNDQP